MDIPRRRDFLKNKARDLLGADPSMTNKQIALDLGVHRNTVSSYVQEIVSEDDKRRKVRRRMVLASLLERGEVHRAELMELCTEAYKSDTPRKQPNKVANVIMRKWELEKELVKIELLLV